jgi:FtsZ-binding cell division protein ZapB
MTPYQRIHLLGSLVFSTQRVVEQLRHKIARARGETITMSIDEAKEMASRLEELSHEVRETRSSLVAVRNTDANVVYADPALTAAHGEPTI